MQCTSFLPGSYSTRDINVGAHSSIWPVYNKDMTLKTGQSYNVFLPRPPMDQCSGYDKEIFRQTILEHEATFKDQVHELHRLYKRQRELMDEIKRSELSKHQLQLQICQSNPSPSQNSPGYSDKTWQIPSLPWVNPAGSKPSVSHSKNYQMPNGFNPQKSMQVGHDPNRIEKNLNDCKSMESKFVRSKRRMLDLELPADEYIDGEDGEGFGERVSEVPCYPPKRMSEVFSKSDFNLFPGSGLFNSVSQGGSSSHGPFSGRANNAADLNGPVRIDDAITPNSGRLLGFKACHREMPSWEQDLSGKSTSSFQVFSKEIFCNIQGENDAEDWSKIGNLQRGRQWELPPQNGEGGQSRKGLSFIPQISYAEKLSTPSMSLNVEPRTEYAMVNQLDRCDGKLWGERPNFSSGNLGGNHDLSNDNYLGHMGSSVDTSCQLVNHCNETKTEPSELSFRRNPIRGQNPIAVQALPCFNISLPLSKSSKSSASRLSGNKFHLSQSSISSVGNGTHLGNSFSVGSKSELRTIEACAQSISINNQSCNSANDSAVELHNLRKCFQDSDYKGVNSRTSMDLNFLPPGCLLDTEAFLQNTGTVNGAKKLEELGRLSWRVEKPDSSGRLNIEREDSTQMNSVLSQPFPQYVHNGGPKRFEFSSSSTHGKILEFSRFDRPHSSNIHCAPTSSSTSLPIPFEDKDNHCKKVGLLDINLPHNPASMSVTECTKDNPDIEIGVDNKFLEAGNHIDLNSCIDEDESSPVHTTPRVIMKAMAEKDLEALGEKKEIDLEAPMSPENKECSPPRGKSEENQLETPLQMSMPELGDPQGELVRMAAKAIVEISSYGFQKLSLEDSACNLLDAWRNDSLHWFASVVPFVAGKLENEVGVVVSSEDASDQELSSNECDSFEAMTLKLGETEAECYCCENSSQKEEETSAISSPSQPRRGRLRKGRPGKDFQTEVLPSIASLSRHEVKEDLQTIGGLMKAAGTPLVTNRGTRNMGRYRCTRARRQSIIPHCNTVESKFGPLLKQQRVDRIVVAIEERFLTGWGKTKSRRRGQRFAAINPARLFS